MEKGGLGKSKRRNGKAPTELGDESSPGAVIILSESDSVESIDVGDPKLKSATIDLISKRRNQQVLEKELSRLLSIFPDADPRVAATDLASHLMKTSPERALERIIYRYLEHGAPKAEQGPHEGPMPDPPQAISEKPTDAFEKPSLHRVGTSIDEEIADPPQAIEKPTDAFEMPSLHSVGTSNHEERQVLLPELTANYKDWTYYTLAKEFPRYPLRELKRVLHENNGWYAPSYKAISSGYKAALAAELKEQGRKRRRRRKYPKLNQRPRVPTFKPHEPCSIFERELQSIQNASAEGAN